MYSSHRSDVPKSTLTCRKGSENAAVEQAAYRNTAFARAVVLTGEDSRAGKVLEENLELSAHLFL